MPKFMAVHTFPANSMTVEQCRQIGRAGQNDPVIRGDRSYISLSEGKALCIVDASKREDVEEWCRKMNMPFDCVCEVEIVGERGWMTELETHVAVH